MWWRFKIFVSNFLFTFCCLLGHIARLPNARIPWGYQNERSSDWYRVWVSKSSSLQAEDVTVFANLLFNIVIQNDFISLYRKNSSRRWRPLIASLYIRPLSAIQRRPQFNQDVYIYRLNLHRSKQFTAARLARGIHAEECDAYRIDCGGKFCQVWESCSTSADWRP